MTAYHWHDTRQRAIELFGEAPSAQLEQDVLEHFTERPAHVAQLVERIGAKVQAGKIRSGWAVLRKELNTTPGADVTATDEADRDRRIRSAKQWIDNAGIHYDLERHITAELFGDDQSTGRLQDLNLTQAQREELLDHWRTNRPRGEQAEHDANAWMAECAGSRNKVREIIERKKRELEQAQA